MPRSPISVYVKPVAFEEIRGPKGKVLWSRRVMGTKGAGHGQ